MLLITEVKPHRFVLCQCLDATNINKRAGTKNIYVNIHATRDDHYSLLCASREHLIQKYNLKFYKFYVEVILTRLIIFKCLINLLGQSRHYFFLRYLYLKIYFSGFS